MRTSLFRRIHRSLLIAAPCEKAGFGLVLSSAGRVANQARSTPSKPNGGRARVREDRRIAQD